MTTEDGKSLTPLFGPGYTGLKNLGNSCYLASVCQVVFSIQEIGIPFMELHQQHPLSCQSPPASCYLCQMSKMAYGLLSGEYSIPLTGENEEITGQDGISPNMWKDLVGKGHSEFSSMRQQDAQEFLSHLLSFMEHKERSHSMDSCKLFRFQMQQKLSCVTCSRVGYKNENPSLLTLRVPSIPTGKVNESGKPEYEPCSFQQILNSYFSNDSREFKCPHEQSQTLSNVLYRFTTFPDVLVCVLSRFVLSSNWVIEKTSKFFVLISRIHSFYRCSSEYSREIGFGSI